MIQIPNIPEKSTGDPYLATEFNLFLNKLIAVIQAANTNESSIDLLFQNIEQIEVGTTPEGYAPVHSPAFSGTPTAPTPVSDDNSTKLATTAFVTAAITSLIDNSPAALDTLKELASALNNDPDFATTITTLIGEKLAKASNLSDLADVSAARQNLGLSGTVITHNHDGAYEPVFVKKTAFNKAFGNQSGQVCQGDDPRLSDNRTPTDNSVEESKLSNAYKNIEEVAGTVLDWSNMGGTKTLTSDTAFTFSNLRKGVYFFETTGDFSPTFPAGFNYAGGTRAATDTTLYQIVNTSGSGGWYVILKTEN